ncbi:MAG: acetolactate synthase small subunit [Actinomycetota bacterium]|nr:acetolactate synthase small subunit [Actinomycetota bacterium]
MGYHVLSVLVENKAGVLARVAQLFSRRGYNIYSLAVAPTDDERFSRLTVVVDLESVTLEQITKQLHKLINVIKITEIDPRESVQQELLLAIVAADTQSRSQIMELAGIFGAKVIDVGLERLTLALADTPDRLDDFTDLIKVFGIIEVQRTGRVALTKLARPSNRGGMNKGKAS